jgi:hypothetical protein
VTPDTCDLRILAPARTLAWTHDGADPALWLDALDATWAVWRPMRYVVYTVRVEDWGPDPATASAASVAVDATADLRPALERAIEETLAKRRAEGGEWELQGVRSDGDGGRARIVVPTRARTDALSVQNEDGVLSRGYALEPAPALGDRATWWLVAQRLHGLGSHVRVSVAPSGGSSLVIGLGPVPFATGPDRGAESVVTTSGATHGEWQRANAVVVEHLIDQLRARGWRPSP